jgi:hypothetical protein
LNHRAAVLWVCLAVIFDKVDFFAQNATCCVDFFGGHFDAIVPNRACRCTGAREFGNACDTDICE